MFQLIIAIIAIALVALLAVASLYYGGSAFSTGSARAAAATVVSQAQQINAAEVLYANDNSGAIPATVLALNTSTPQYLQAVPVLPSNIGGTVAWTVDGSKNGLIYAQVANQAICSQINTQAGIATPTPLTTAPTTSTSGTLSSILTASQYGCAATTGTTPTYWVAYM